MGQVSQHGLLPNVILDTKRQPQHTRSPQTIGQYYYCHDVNAYQVVTEVSKTLSLAITYHRNLIYTITCTSCKQLLSNNTR